MEILQILGYAVGLLVGFVMGMFGGGGSLLLPALLYLLEKHIDLATAYTIVLVGLSATVGLIPRVISKHVDFGTAIALGVPVTLGTLLVRVYLYRLIPNTLFTIGDFAVTKQLFVLGLFCIFLFLSFASMSGLIGQNFKPRPELKQNNPWAYYSVLFLCGLLIGIIPAFSGAGGGVLIVPLLVIFFGLPIKTVIGTSLLIVSVKSIVGFVGGDVMKIGPLIEWPFLAGFAPMMIIGVLIGSYVARKIDSSKLKIYFAWFVLCLAIFILTKETLFPAMKVKKVPQENSVSLLLDDKALIPLEFGSQSQSHESFSTP